MVPDTKNQDLPPPPPPGVVTGILAEVREGSDRARDELFRVIYAELRRIAAVAMRGQRAGHTIQPTALVHEAYLKLMGGAEMAWNDRIHFLATAARAMRSILVDHARSHARQKRAGERKRVPLHSNLAAGAETPDLDILAVHEALERLEEASPERARVVELRFFGGLSNEETAKTLGVTERTVYRMWQYARAWLHREITS